MNFYNEWDAGAAAWLRELIKAGLIPPGIVDERSITEITPGDLAGFTQCHFFCGIGGWPLALQLAGVPATVPLWTGSPPCQPFSVAGAQVGFDDPRHLAPALLELIAQCRPPVVFGEQVSAAIGKHWLDFIFLDLEAEGYTCGAAVLPAASVGAPHKRDRLFFGAVGNAFGKRHDGFNPLLREEERQRREGSISEATRAGKIGDLANALCEQWDRSGDIGQGRRTELTDYGGGSGMADTYGRNPSPEREQRIGEHRQQQENVSPMREGLRRERSDHDNGSTNTHHSFWSDADWLGCRDGKFRPVEPGTFPLVDGFPNRVAALRGAGNAIVPQAAAKFIKAFQGAIADCGEGCRDD